VNAPSPGAPGCVATPSLATRLFALLAPPAIDADSPAEALWLAAQGSGPLDPDLDRLLADWQAAPPPDDRRLHRLAGLLALAPAEIIALALAFAADTEVAASRALAWLQAPRRDAHPTLGLIAALEAQRGVPVARTLATLLDGAALDAELLLLDTAGRALPDARLRLPQPLLAALAGGVGRWPGVRLGDPDLPPPAPSTEAAARAHGATLTRGLVVRSGHPREARSACAAVARGIGRRAAFIDGDPPAGLGPWLALHEALPVIAAELGPGERRSLPRLPGHAGPVLVATGLDGAWDLAGAGLDDWTLPLPDAAERRQLWVAQAFPADAADTLGRSHRHSSARIAELAAAARLDARARGHAVGVAEVARAARAARIDALGSLAERVAEDIPDEALVLPPALRRELEALLIRARARDGLAEGLGPSARARYRPGVRALLVGASGTGKTLACGWLATRLGLPLYRIDLAAISSKYIGETEKNLAQLFARAEAAELILLFDEADALFGKRTEVKDANDRYANQQTNYLLQRIEAFDGIALLTSNSRARFDSAFTRRLDAILEFPLPAADERRALWIAHFGDAHALTPAELNRIAAGCELAGGHIRNATLAARALSGSEPIRLPALLAALAAEYRKLGRSVPAGLLPLSITGSTAGSMSGAG
jgi:hypothetical protein